ncbi:MAG TPA: cupin domain-containing protein [Candidatus Nanopelagicaceae bacterium]|nr:cupin domain-containing protein [Candidatus Nanopelagicaceae bacterium]
MSLADQYFSQTGSGRPPTAPGRFVDLQRGGDPVEFVPGLEFRYLLGERTMLMAVHFEPNTEAPVHVHDEEQITLVVEGELEFEIDGDVRRLTPGMAAVVPANVPHGARTKEVACLEFDVFNPPRQALLDLAGAGPQQASE